MVEGVVEGFTRVLEINGVGYRAEARGADALPDARLLASDRVPAAARASRAKVDKQVVITLEGARPRAARRRSRRRSASCRPPEPYKGKGVKYAEETIRRKAGKAAGAVAR